VRGRINGCYQPGIELRYQIRGMKKPAASMFETAGLLNAG